MLGTGAKASQDVAGEHLRVVSDLIGAPAEFIDWPGKKLSRSDRTVPVSATVDSRPETFVVHTLDILEVFDEAAATGSARAEGLLPRGKRVGDKFVTVRHYAALLSEEINKARTVSAADAMRFILEVLDDLVERHEGGRAHGDIRPENVEILDGHARLIDAGFRELFDELDEYKKMYVAPELRSPEKSLATPSGDVYSFLRLARSLLRPFMGDAKVARHESQWSWMFDAAYVSRPESRPSAVALREVFVDSSLGRMRDDIDAFLDGFLDGKRELTKQDFTWLGGTERLSNQVAKAVREDIALWPETSLYMTTESAKRLLVWRAVDSSRPQVQNRQYVNFEEQKSRVGIPGMERLPEHIDERWMNRIHLDFYEKGIGPEHEANLPDPATLSEPQRATDSRYRRYLDLADRVRQTILAENDFSHTDDVSALISGLALEVQPLDIVTMRQWGHILAVPDHDRWLYPNFQFDPETGLPSPFIKTMNDARAAGRIGPPDEWATLALWSQPRHELDELAPRDLLWDEQARQRLADFINGLSAA